MGTGIDFKNFNVSNVVQLQPKIEEMVGGQEFVADGWVILPHKSLALMTTVPYHERNGRYYEVCRLHFPMPCWQKNFLRTAAALNLII